MRRRKSKFIYKDWRPENLGKGLYDFAIESSPELTRADFGVGLKTYLRERHSSLNIEQGVIDGLYKRTYYCLQLSEALPKFRAQLKSREWQNQKKEIQNLIRLLNETEKAFEDFGRTNALPLTTQSIGSITQRMKSVRKSLTAKRHLIDRLVANDKRLLSGYLKPDLKSQFRLSIYNLLLREMPDLKVEERILVIAGCAYVARLLRASQDKESPHVLIYMRIRRARQRYRTDAVKYGWDRVD